ncbi:hypothetical protein K458DRAFT_423496 [Lentithecium fluviatile CBS 122367]|uniref:Uncharacterized protein n=1 Tax=Lentithecium fluviatile CBS 122367 TaxID=1168545 RepID=A0A6G1II75_9PLEO|nr:hypothetical protein K458DRAFT_423496 [Lentithecium fluviatile CBS 122367]
MAAPRAQKASWLALFLGLATVQAQTSTGAFWTYTSRYMDYISTTKYTYASDDTTTYSYTSTRTIKSNVTPTQTPYSTSTQSSYYSWDEDLEIVYAYYSDGAVPEADLEPTYDYSATRTTSSTMSLYTVFYMPVTYTAPASCPTQFTFSTEENVSVPTEVRDQVTPTSVSTGAVTTFLTYGPSQTEYWYLSSGAAPLHTSTAFYYSYYIADCDMPGTGSSGGGGSGSSSGGGDDLSLTVCSWYSGCTSLKTWVIIIASIIPGLFVLGFLESWFWFRRLMLGKGALRFGTICWICISLWVACFTRAQSARSAEDQKLLREKWNNTGSGEAFKLWWKWGFRHAYPVPLLGQYSRNTVGIVPADQPLPQMGQTTNNIQYGPGFQPPPGGPQPYYPSGPQGGPQPYYPSGVPSQNGQSPAYYPPPQGWSPGPNGQGYPMPPPGQYMPPQNGAANYYDASKEAPSVTERTVSPPLSGIQAPYPAPTPPATVPSPHENAVEAPTPPTQPVQLPATYEAQAPPPNTYEAQAPPSNTYEAQAPQPGSPPPRQT